MSDREDIRYGAFLHAHGVRVKRRDLADAVAEAVASLPARLGGRTVDELTASELAVLRRGGLDPEERRGAKGVPIGGVALLAALVEDGLTTQAAARLLEVDPSRIRQRLLAEPPTLLGIQHGRGWRLPRFQFEGRRVVPGFESVLGAVDPELSPVSLFRWFTTPCVDLTDARQDEPLTPREWLLSGRSAEPVVALAREL